MFFYTSKPLLCPQTAAVCRTIPNNLRYQEVISHNYVTSIFGMEAGSTAKIQCKSQYKLTQPDRTLELTCSATGAWEPDLIGCASKCVCVCVCVLLLSLLLLSATMYTKWRKLVVNSLLYLVNLKSLILHFCLKLFVSLCKRTTLL